MRLWGALYLAIWVVFLEFLFGLWPDPPVFVPYLHLVVGFGIVALAYYCFDQLRRTSVPGRVKRIARASFALSILMVVLGLLLWFDVGVSWALPVVGLSFYRAVMFLHVVNAIAIITQLAAVAIAYDMWEDHEFEKETKPGEIPPPATAPEPQSLDSS